MRKALYTRLAADALKKNRRLYAPYLIACALMSAMLYILLALKDDPALREIPGGESVGAALFFGSIVIGIFSAAILFYTNGVLTKQRKREFGLYSVLGMEKRHMGRMLLWETVYTALIAIPAGIASGIAFSKLMQLILMRLLGEDAKFGLRVDPGAMLATACIFLGVFSLICLNNLRIVRFAKPVELLRGAQEGEKEPKSKWVLALLGVVSLAAGYFVAISARDVYSALLLFFLAVLLVILGTYLTFIAFSIVFLKALRKNKGYYYRTNHFATVSGMLYRMKRNAAGLASICILSTMVLVTVSTTVCLYAGVDNIVDSRYPFDVQISYSDGLVEGSMAEMEKTVRDIVDDRRLEMRDYGAYRSLSFAGVFEENRFRLHREAGTPIARATMVWLTTADGYRSLSGEGVEIADGEALFFFDGEVPGGVPELEGFPLRFRSLDSFPYESDFRAMGVETLYLVVRDDAALGEIADWQRAAYGEDASEVLTAIRFNLSGTDDEKIACAEAIDEATKVPVENYYVGLVSSRQLAMREDYFSFYGAFFFLGLFLGTLFLIATVLIIYYKQVSEGYDDRERFQIMQKVGMTKAEVRATIRAQVLIVFFLPLVTAAMHILFAFPMIRRILSAFSMNNAGLFALCTLATLSVFAVLYTVVYTVTARTYYNIVSGTERSAP